MSEYSSMACSIPDWMELQYSPGLATGVVTVILKVFRQEMAEMWRLNL